MNKFIVTFLFLHPFLLFAQNSVIEDFISRFQNEEMAVHLQMDGWLLQMAAANMEPSLEQKAVQAIEKLRVFILEDNKQVTRKDQEKLITNLKKDHFEPFMSLRENDTRIEVLVREKAGLITNVLLTILDEDNFIFLNAEGALALEEFKKLDLGTNMPGVDQIKKYTKNTP